MLRFGIHAQLLLVGGCVHVLLKVKDMSAVYITRHKISSHYINDSSALCFSLSKQSQSCMIYSKVFLKIRLCHAHWEPDHLGVYYTPVLQISCQTLGATSKHVYLKHGVCWKASSVHCPKGNRFTAIKHKM